MIRLLSVGGPQVVRRGVSTLLQAHEDFLVVGELDRGSEAWGRILTELRLDVVILHEDAVSDLERLMSEEEPGALPDFLPQFLLMVGRDDGTSWALRALRAGVDGYVREDDPVEDLVQAIKVVSNGGAWLPPWFARQLLDHYRLHTLERREPLPAAAPLSVRERDVVHLIALGNSNIEIAASLGLAESTIKTHVSRILRKLALRDRTQLARFAHENALV